MVEMVDVSKLRIAAEKAAKLTNRVETMQVQRAATAEVKGPLAGLFKKRGIGAAVPTIPKPPEYVFTEYLDGVHSLLCKGTDITCNKGEGSLETELDASRDLKEALRQLAGSGTTSPVLGGLGAVASIVARHQAIRKLQNDGIKGS